MTNTEKLELIEKARAEFERNVKAATGEKHVHVMVSIHMADSMLDSAPESWKKGSFTDGTRYADSGSLSSTNVYGKAGEK